MGYIESKGLCCCNKKTSLDHDFCIDIKSFNKPDIMNIIKIQSMIRGYLFRIKQFPESYPQIKEISMDYNTDYLENNPIIIKLNNLLQKFELSEKETYEINNSNLKIVAILYPNKTIYKGMVDKNFIREGFGKLYLSNGTIYKGFFHKNLMQGRGRILNINGFVYDGEFDKSLSHGYGKYVSLDGTTYKGSWYKDKQCGYGDETYPDGSHYKGNFKNGKKNGTGKFIFKELNIYEGNFIDNRIEGEGTYHWKDGRIYIGKWYNNKMQGYGIFIWPDKKRYYGRYINNVKDGFGIFFWGDGHKFEGFWSNGKQNGFGLIKKINDNNDIIKYGQWFDGKFMNKIDDDNLKKKINNMIEYQKNTNEFLEFKTNIERYEKFIVDSAYSQETGDNSINGQENDIKLDSGDGNE